MIRNSRSVQATVGTGVWVVDDPELCCGISRIVSTHELYIMDGIIVRPRPVFCRSVQRNPFRCWVCLFDDARITSSRFIDGCSYRNVGSEFVHERLVEALHLQSAPSVVIEQPAGHDDIGVWSMGEWWSGHLAEPDELDPVAAIDPVRLQNQIIGPILRDRPRPSGRTHRVLPRQC